MPWASTTSSRLALLAIALAMCALWPRLAYAEINRCQGPDGGMIYTDRRCEDIGATPAAAKSHQTRRRPPRTGCARNLAELVLRISNAISQQDTNQLAAVYHWTGMSGNQSRSLLRRLDGVAHRPLAGIVPVVPQSTEFTEEEVAAAEYYARRPVRQRPVALRIEQSSAGGITPSHTVFALHRHFGCWWIRG